MIMGSHTLGWALTFLLCFTLINETCGECGLPGRISYAEPKQGALDAKTFPPDATVSYNCRPGFIRVPGTRSSITCLKDGTWSTPEEFCQRRTCGNPGEVMNGQMEAKDFLFGSTVKYTCNEGFRLSINRNFRECLADGTWSNVLPQCDAVLCAAPESPANGEFNPQKYDYGYLDSVTFSCQKPFEVVGNASISCTATGEWSSNSPSCKALICDNIWELQEEARRCTSTPDEWIKYLQVQYLYLQIENLKLDIDIKKKKLSAEKKKENRARN